MKDIVRIYTLSDPITNEVRYVGRTVNQLTRRLSQHIRTAVKGKLVDKQKEVWIKGLLNDGLSPIITEIAISCLDHFQSDEKKWVEHYRSICPNLLNVKCGGDGGLGGHFVYWTPEQKALLGTVSDSEVAKVMGISRKAISYWREQFGIEASFDRTNNTPPPVMGGHNRITLSQSIIERMGKEPDYVIAAELGLDKSIIARRRKSLGIPSYAANTGNAGCFTKGMPHPRWSKNGSQSTSATI